MLIMLIPVCPASAEIGDSITISVQSSKTLMVRPFEPVEYDILSAYNAVYESLVTLDDDYLPQPCLAESWEESASGRTWTFYLRQDVRFSDGTPLTAQDVVSSAEYILARANDENIADHGYYQNLNRFIDSISAKDDYTVVIKTDGSRAYYGLLFQMTFPVVPADRVSNDNPPGSGPYVITEFHAGERMWLSANTNWWKAQPQVKEILFEFKNTSGAVVESYEFAQVQACFTRSVAGAQHKTGTNSLTMSYRTNQLECLYMNNNASELTPEVRKAIRCLIDKNKLISTAYLGLAVPTNFPFYPGTWMYNDSLDSSFTLDIEEARRLLAEAGWEDSDDNGVLDRVDANGDLKNLHLRFYYYEEPDNSVREEAANIIASALAEVGIECKISAMTMSGLQDKLKSGSFDLALIAFSMDVTPDCGFMLMSANVKSGNYCRYKSSKMDDLFTGLRKQTSYEDFRQKLMDIQYQFYTDCPFVCLYFRTGNVISREMYTTCRDIREFELLRGIESFSTH